MNNKINLTVNFVHLPDGTKNPFVMKLQQNQNTASKFSRSGLLPKFVNNIKEVVNLTFALLCCFFASGRLMNGVLGSHASLSFKFSMLYNYYFTGKQSFLFSGS